MDKIKILLLEDDKLIAKNLKEILEKWGYEVVDINSTAEDAFEIMYSDCIDLIISDIEIKGLVDGIEASKIFQNIYNTPIIFITAYSDDEKIQRASNLKNMIGYLIKPIKISDLKNLIDLADEKYNLAHKNHLVSIDENYIYNRKNKRLLKNDVEIELTRNEKLLLSILINSKDEVVSYDTINESIWQNQDVPNGTRRQLIYRLKNKLKDLNLSSQKGVGVSFKK